MAITDKIEIRKYHQNGVSHVEDMMPSMCVMVTTHVPHTTPWDYYGRKWGSEKVKVLKAGGIPAKVLETRRTSLHPCGTGPGGRVRMGDNWRPSIYKLIVEKYYLEKAHRLLAAHDKAVLAWIHDGEPMPDACK